MKNLTLSNRQFFVYSVIIFFIFILIGKSFYLQVIENKKYDKLASNNSQTKQIIIPERGLIYDRNEMLLVKNDKIAPLCNVIAKIAGSMEGP